MPSHSEVEYPRLPDEIYVRVVEGAEAVLMAQPQPRQVDVYAPSFHLWDSAPLLDLLFNAADAPRQKGRASPMLFLNLLVPNDDSSQRPL
jgi:hypothetical protein